MKLNENNSKAYIKKGTALFQMDEIGKALDVFKEGQKRFESDSVYVGWIKKCEDKLPSPKAETESPKIPQPAPAEKAACASSPSAVRHEWYQTHTHVVVTVLAKNVKKDNLSVDVEDRKLNVLIKEYQGSPVDLNFFLAHTVVPQESQTKLFASKVEIKLKKSEGIQWPKLEGSAEEKESVTPLAAAPIPEGDVPKYPSSSHYTRDWDKLAAEVTKEEKDEKLDGDAGLNQFFQKLYADASDDTKKAMMKSFSESGGTVLSTNWSEVGSKPVEVKPPDGLEYKKWEC
ncbi:protein SGT1 homolog isoform X2 [Aplysia californica]|nr:protein SGT1 homolog isoform X2 [Aplysia californica]XP_035824374.1 protein SGT1 homolog isoform X2 [Aplysia californica]